MLDPVVLTQTATDLGTLQPAPIIPDLTGEGLAVALPWVAYRWIERHYDHLENKRVDDSLNDA